MSLVIQHISPAVAHLLFVALLLTVERGHIQVVDLLELLVVLDDLLDVAVLVRLPDPLLLSVVIGFVLLAY